MHLFYTPDIAGDSHILNEQESKHAVRVLRIAEDDEVILVDGRGGWYRARVIEVLPKACRLEVLSAEENHMPLPYHLHIAISPTKSINRFEWFLEKATEMGISEITPLYCHRTERMKVNSHRMEKILVSAMKQSLKAFKPKLNKPTALKDFLSQPGEGFKGIAHCLREERIPLSSLKKKGSYTLLIGPEGDFTPEEVNLALSAGYQPLSLGPFRLRTETSGVHLCSSIQILESQESP